MMNQSDDNVYSEGVSVNEATNDADSSPDVSASSGVTLGADASGAAGPGPRGTIIVAPTASFESAPEVDLVPGKVVVRVNATVEQPEIVEVVGVVEITTGTADGAIAEPTAGGAGSVERDVTQEAGQDEGVAPTEDAPSEGYVPGPGPHGTTIVASTRPPESAPEVHSVQSESVVGPNATDEPREIVEANGVVQSATGTADEAVVEPTAGGGGGPVAEEIARHAGQAEGVAQTEDAPSEGYVPGPGPHGTTIVASTRPPESAPEVDSAPGEGVVGANATVEQPEIVEVVSVVESSTGAMDGAIVEPPGGAGGAVEEDITHEAGQAEGAAPTGDTPFDGGATVELPGEAQAPRAGGTILIPPGMSSLPDLLRSVTPVGAPVDHTVMKPSIDEAASASASDILRRPNPPSLPPAVLAAAAARASKPPTRGMPVPASLDPSSRQQNIEARKGRRHTTILVGSLGAGVLALVVVLGVVLVGRGNAKANAGRTFLAAQQVALATTADVNGDLVERMFAASEAPKANPADLKDIVVAARTKVSSLSLPVATGTYALASARLASAIAAETAFLDGMASLTEKKLVEVDEGDIERIDSLWKHATEALAGTYVDARTVSLPTWDRWSASISDFGRAVTASADTARANAAELAVLEQYRAQTMALLDRYESLRTQLGDYEARKKYVYTSSDASSVRGMFDGASSARYELATQLSAIAPPPTFVSTHQGMASMITRLAGEVKNAANAANEAYCGTDSYFYRGTTCVPIGDTSIYKRYILVANAVSDEFTATKNSWLSLYAQESARLS